MITIITGNRGRLGILFGLLLSLFTPSGVFNSNIGRAQTASAATRKPGATPPSSGSQSARPDRASQISGLSKLKHLIFMVKENRSFDDFFGAFPIPGLQGATTAILSTGQVIPMGPQPDAIRDICHEWSCSIVAQDNGRMDGFDLLQGLISSGQNCSIAGDNLCFTQFTSTTLPNYFKYAQTFAV